MAAKAAKINIPARAAIPTKAACGCRGNVTGTSGYSGKSGFSGQNSSLDMYATDYRHRDKHLRLVMTLIALWCSMDRQTDRRYHYLPASMFYVVDNEPDLICI